MSYVPPHGRLPRAIRAGQGRAGISPFPAASDHEHPWSGIPPQTIQRNYRWSTSLAEADPGHGMMRANNAPALATELYISVFDNTDAVFYGLTSLAAGDVILVYEAGEMGRWIRYEVTAPAVVTANQWVTVEVAWVSSGGAGFGPNNNEEVELGITGTGGGGGGGGGTPAYVHNQAVAAVTWVIDHPLGFRPNVTVVDSAGETVEGEVIYTDTDTITLHFSAAFSGIAYLS